MFYFEFPLIDTTLYEATPSSSTNTGIDEILEVRKDMNDSGTQIDVSRILMKFDYSFISKSIQEGTIPSTAKYYLNLYDAQSSELAVEQELYAYMVSQSWDGGTGFYSRDPALSDGASWKYRDNDTTKTEWVSGSLTQGGTWWTGSIGGTAAEYEVSASYTLSYETQDIRMNITDLVKNHIYSSSAYSNNGFIIKRENLPTTQSAVTIYDPTLSSGSAEGNTTHYGNLKFFSRETNTIYSPKLEVEWDDSSFSTGSLGAVSASEMENLTVYFKNLRPEYREDSKVKFRIVGRELYPERTFASTPAALTTKWLPSGSGRMNQGTYYSVKDARTEEVLIPFSTGSIVSCDSSGNYFNFWMNGFQPERFYRFQIKVVSGSGTDETSMIYDDGYEFKVVRK
tara:strand:+ start:118 stop:1308 length:1191 start_codon:yes stop_codon:yes gene_type:complete